MQEIEKILTLWRTGWISSERVAKWADAEIERVDQPSKELLDLAMDGPEACLKRPSHEFRARPLELDYGLEFSLRAVAVALSSRESVWEFAQWASRSCIGEHDVDSPMVSFGYELDDLLDYITGEGPAFEFVRAGLPELLPLCRENVKRFVAGLSISMPTEAT